MRRMMLALALTNALLAGCSRPQAAAPTAVTEAAVAPTAALTHTPAPAPTAAPTAPAGTPDDAAIIAGIQATLDAYASAFNQNKQDILESTVDQSNAPFRRLVEERFNTYQKSVFAGSHDWKFTVDGIERRDLGFVLGHIVGGGQTRYDWLFREVDGKWLLSEPTERQLGARYTFQSAHFTYQAYHWSDSDDVNKQLADLMERARAKVLEKLGKVPEEKYTVNIRPIFGLTPPSSPNALAWYQPAARPIGDRMQINAPESYQFGGYDPQTGWQGELLSTLTHEYTHLVHTRSFPQYYGLSDWMSEGLAEYVSDNPRAGEVSAAVASDNIIPIVNRDSVTAPQDLDHLSLLNKDVSLGYGLAYSLVAYIAKTYGGIDGFWKLCGAMRAASGTGEARYDKALQATFGVSYQEFDAGWRAYLKKSY
jgi:hypothetical protein